jgi:hypothetical protein
MAQDERRHGVRERHGSDDLGANLRMNANFLEFLCGERARLRENVLRQPPVLPMSCRSAAGLDGVNLVARHPQHACEARRIGAAPGECDSEPSGPSRSIASASASVVARCSSDIRCAFRRSSSILPRYILYALLASNRDAAVNGSSHSDDADSAEAAMTAHAAAIAPPT